MQTQQPSDKNIKAVVDMMSAVNAGDRGVIHGKIAVWIEELLKKTKRAEDDGRCIANFDL